MASFTFGKPTRWWNQPIPGTGEIPGMKSFGKSVSKGMKAGLITGGVVAGIAALGMWASSSRRNARARAKEDIRNATPDDGAIPQVMMPNMVPMTPPEVGPAEGHAPDEWQNRINASRGLAPQQSAAVNPKMNVVPETSVQDLGTPTPPTR